MPSLDERLKLLRDVGGPDLWEEIRRREPRRPVPGPSSRSRWAAGVVALAVAIAGLFLTIWVFQAGQPRPAAPISNGRIAFSGFDGTSWDIYSVEPDGSGLTELTHLSDQVAEDPAWSPDGERIAYVVVGNGGGGRSDVWVMDAGGSDPRRLTEGPGSSWSPTWSPDGSRIAYAHSAPGRADQIWVMGADGSNARAFTYRDPPECVRDGSPAWSPDGDRIGFVRVSGAGAIVPVSVMVWPVEGSDPKPEDVSLEGATWALDLAWSPDGSKLAFARSTSNGGSIGLWVMDADGSKQRSLTEVASAQSPAWSPDGRQIAFAGHGPGTDHDTLFVMDADGSGAQEIRGLPVEALSPSWQPVLEEPTPTPPAPGTKANGVIVFQSQDGDVYEVESDGSGLRELFPASRDITQIAWALDGNLIAWAGAVDGGYGIYVSAPDGSDARRLTDGANDGWPAWSPDGTRIAFSSSSDPDASRCSRDAEWNLICRTDLYVMRADGSELARITSDPAPEYDPEWSPDGIRIAFTKSDLSGTAIWIANADGSDPRQVSSAEGGSDFRESWSPDGSEIAFSAIRYEDTYLWLVNADGTNERLLTNAGYATGPTWSPDGSLIAFVGITSDLTGAAQSEATRALFVMRSDGSGITEIAEVPGGVAGDIAWQPLPATLAEPSPSEPSIPSPAQATIGDTIDVGQASALAYAAGSVWVDVLDDARTNTGTVLRIDPDTGEIQARISVDAYPDSEHGGSGMAFDGRYVWIVGTRWSKEGPAGGILVRIDQQTNTSETIDLPVGLTDIDLVFDDGFLWTTGVSSPGKDPRVLQIDPAAGEVVSQTPIDAEWWGGLAVEGGAIWITEMSVRNSTVQGDATLVRLQPGTDAVLARVGAVDGNGVMGSTMPIGAGGAIWLPTGSELLELDPQTGAALSRFDLGVGGDFEVAPDGSMWCLCGFGWNELERLDPVAGQADVSVRLAPKPIPVALAVAPNSVWVLTYEGTLTRVELT
jgi:Tol biopolymer transport system component